MSKKISLTKNPNGNIQGSFEKDGKTYEFLTQASFHKDNKMLIKHFIKQNIDSSSVEYIIESLTYCDDRRLAYY